MSIKIDGGTETQWLDFTATPLGIAVVNYGFVKHTLGQVSTVPPEYNSLHSQHQASLNAAKATLLDRLPHHDDAVATTVSSRYAEQVADLQKQLAEAKDAIAKMHVDREKAAAHSTSEIEYHDGINSALGLSLRDARGALKYALQHADNELHRKLVIAHWLAVRACLDEQYGKD